MPFRAGRRVDVAVLLIAAWAATPDKQRTPGAAVEPSSPGDRSSLTVVTDDARLLVIDPRGARTGLDPASGEQIKDIPESVVFVDWIDNDRTGEAATSFTVQVIIDHPSDGTYRIVVVGLGPASELAVHAFSTDGSAQPQVRAQLSLKEKARSEFQLHFRSTPGSTPRLQKIGL